MCSQDIDFATYWQRPQQDYLQTDIEQSKYIMWNIDSLVMEEI